MAGKASPAKGAKPSASGKGKTAKRDKQVQKKLIGTRVYYAGMIEQSCQECGRSWRRGMCSVFQGQYFCTEGCVIKSNKGEI